MEKEFAQGAASCPAGDRPSPTFMEFLGTRAGFLGAQDRLEGLMLLLGMRAALRFHNHPLSPRWGALLVTGDRPGLLRE